MKISMMSIMLDPLPPETIVQCTTNCRISAIDWIGLHGTTARRLHRLSADAGLKVVAHTMLKGKFLRRDAGYRDEFKASLDDALELGAPVLMLPPFARQGQISLEDDRKAWIEYYAWAAPLARSAGIQLSTEPTGFLESPITRAEELSEVLEAVPELALTFDSGNLATAGGDPAEGYKMLKDRIVHFHLKDWHIFESPHEDADLKRCGKYFSDAMIGDGDMDLKGFWDQVDDRAKTLYVNLETRDFSRRLSAPDSIKLVAERLRSW